MLNLVLMRGCPGSGKTTLVSEVISYMFARYAESMMVCSADDWFIDDDGVYLFDTSKLAGAHRYCRTVARKSMGLSLDLVIIDNTNTTWSEMKDYEYMGIEYGYDIYICEPKTWWKFNVDELTKRNTHTVPKDSIKKMLDRWQDSDKIIAEHSEFGIKKLEI